MFNKLKTAIVVSGMAMFLAACSSAPAPTASPVASAPQIVPMSSPANTGDSCCYKPSELVRYQDKKVAECSKKVEVMRHSTTCTDCDYPVVVRSTSQCCGPVQSTPP